MARDVVGGRRGHGRGAVREGGGRRPALDIVGEAHTAKFHIAARDHPRYEERLAEQIAAAQKKGKGDLQNLFTSGETWTVE